MILELSAEKLTAPETGKQMALALDRQTSRAEAANGDFRTVHYGKSWEQFEHLHKCFEDSPGVRLSYYKGTIGILMPGVAHELFKSVIGFLIEAFLLDREVEFFPTGSATQKKEGIAATEPDESYEIQGVKLAVEINFTSGDESKLDRYRELSVDEVWIWEDGVLCVYHLIDDEYKPVTSSRIPALSCINLVVLSNCILIGETSRIKAAKNLLKAHPSKK